MILIEDAKYSCLECIRGHRSSLCRHYMRPLLQVRSKGRPNVSANGNPNHRIAVFAEEIDEANCNSRQTPVVILKATPKQIIDLVNGEVIGPYEEKSAAIASPSPNEKNTKQAGPEPVSVSVPIAQREGLISTGSKLCCSTKGAAATGGSGANSAPITTTPTKSCCSSSPTTGVPATTPKHQSCCCESKSAAVSSGGVSKGKGSCGCSNNKRKGSKIFKSKILQKYLKNHLKELELEKQHQVPPVKSEPPANFYNDTIPNNLFNDTAFVPNMPLVSNAVGGMNPIFGPSDGQHSSHNNAFDIVSVSSCSIPGKCSCTANCSCAGCITHGVQSNDSPNYLFDPILQGNTDSLEQLFTKAQIQHNPVPNTVMQPPALNSLNIGGDAQIPTTNYLAFPEPQMPPIKQEPNYPVDYSSMPPQGAYHQLDYTFQEPIEQKPSLQPALPPETEISSDYTRTQIPFSQQTPQTSVAYATGDNQYSSPGYKPLPMQSETSDAGCMCPSDDCNCLNCETHGIIDGLKLDEYFFGPNTKLDKRLLDIFESSFNGMSQ